MFIRTAISTVLYLMANIFLGICFLLIKNPTCQKQRGRLDITTGCSRASNCQVREKGIYWWLS
jgi:hypothetical protein